MADGGGHRGARIMAAGVMDLWRDRFCAGIGHARRVPGQSAGAPLGERGGAGAYRPGEGGALPVAMAGADSAFWVMVLQRRQRGLEYWLGVFDYMASRVFAGCAQTGSRDR